MQKQKMYIKGAPSSAPFLKEIDILIADTFLTRFAGLMFRQKLPAATGLFLAPCNSVHMCFMRFAIDVIFLDKEGKVVHIEEAMTPRSVSGNVREACDVVELNAFRARELGITCGKQCEFREIK